MRNVVFIVLFGIAAAISTGCASDPGIDVRYKLEKRIWSAQLLERKIWREPLRVNYDAVDDTIDAYRGILDWEMLGAENAERWSPRIQVEVRERILRCKLALAKLYFLRFQDNAGVTYFRSGLGRHDLMFLDYPDIGLEGAKELYRSLSGDTLELECARLVREIMDDPVLWLGDVQIGDTLLAVPLYLTRTELDNSARPNVLPEYAELANEFYSQVIAAWPDSLDGYRAMIKRADLFVLLERFEDALATIDAAVKSPRSKRDRTELELYDAEIRAHGLGRYADTEPVFRRLIATATRRDIVDTAKLDLAVLLLRTSRSGEAIELLRDIQLDDDASSETATAAMFVRAVHLKNRGNWPDALNTLWRICRLHPFTRASFVAPLAIIRHYVKTGDIEGAERAQEKTAKFFLETIEKDSGSIRYRHLLKDYLIESYLIVNDPLSAAETLETRAIDWKGENGAVGLFKSAMIYLNLLEDKENGVRMLKKCLDVFPDTRYSRIVRGQIQTVSNQPLVE